MTKQTFSKRDYSILLGNLLDHFDSSLYAFLVPVLAPIFFPNHDPIVSIIIAYSFMATSVITRPLGAFIFGLVARKFGPLFAMSYSLSGVSIFGTAIGFIPDHSQIGFWAAILLFIMRFIKGIFGAGENAIVKLYILEGKTDSEAFKASYIYQGSSMVGMIFASAVSTLILWLDRTDLWRYCFIGSGFAYFVASSMRYAGSSFKEKKLFENYEFSIFKLFWKNKLPMLSVALTTSLSHMTYAVPFVLMNSLMPLITNVTLAEMMKLNTLLLVFDMIMIFIAGPILSKFNYLSIIKISSLLIILTIPVLIVFLPGASIWYISVTRLWIIFLGVIFMSPQNLYYKKLFESKKESYVLVGMANAFGAGIIGKTIPVVSMWLWYKSGSILIISGYVGFLALVCHLIFIKTKIDGV